MEKNKIHVWSYMPFSRSPKDSKSTCLCFSCNDVTLGRPISSHHTGRHRSHLWDLGSARVHGRRTGPCSENAVRPAVPEKGCSDRKRLEVWRKRLEVEKHDDREGWDGPNSDAFLRFYSCGGSAMGNWPLKGWSKSGSNDSERDTECDASSKP